ncbi:uncharacterized protein LOC143038461 isoform X2 [Oratosquilla oratoria]|uniref:uncharacterized protein LOC143038461 isoform X2 n=1 Tax=Oratosquilla oratoria TaxID=337810 RepID=UPI003F776B2F
MKLLRKCLSRKITSKRLRNSAEKYLRKELTTAQAIYRPGEGINLALVHIVPFDVCTGVILLGIQGAVVANIRSQRNDKNSD